MSEPRLETVINLMSTLVAQFGANCQASFYELINDEALLHSSVGTVMDVPPGPDSLVRYWINSGK